MADKKGLLPRVILKLIDALSILDEPLVQLAYNRTLARAGLATSPWHVFDAQDAVLALLFPQDAFKLLGFAKEGLLSDSTCCFELQ
jgi:hypothetical protein